MVQVSEPRKKPRPNADIAERVDQVIALVEHEIVHAKQMSRVQVTDMLLSILEPLSDLRNQIKDREL